LAQNIESQPLIELPEEMEGIIMGKNHNIMTGSIDDDGTKKTICKECINCIIDNPRLPEERQYQYDYAKCKATRTLSPPRINLLSGANETKDPEFTYCSFKNHGECVDFEPHPRRIIEVESSGVKYSKNLNETNSLIDKINNCINKINKLIGKITFE